MGASKKTESRWRAVVRDQEASGKSVREFAQLRGLAPASLYWWRSQLRRRGARQREGLQLARVTVVDAKTSGTRPSDGFEVLLGNGRRLLVPRDLDAVTLRHLIATLER